MHYKSFQEWYNRGVELREARDKNNDDVAEWARDGKRDFGADAEQGFTLFSEFTITNYLSAMRRTPDSVIPANTKRKIGISARQAVAPLEKYPDVQTRLLEQYGAGVSRETIREAVADFLDIANPDDGNDHAGVKTATVWDDLETLEVESSEVGGLWARIMRLLTTVRGKRVRLIIQVAESVDTKTGEIRHA